MSPLYSIYAIVLNWRINQKIGLYNITSIKYKDKSNIDKIFDCKKEIGTDDGGLPIHEYIKKLNNISYNKEHPVTVVLEVNPVMEKYEKKIRLITQKMIGIKKEMIKELSKQEGKLKIILCCCLHN